MQRVSWRYAEPFDRPLKNPWERFGAPDFAGNYDGVEIAFELQPGQQRSQTFVPIRNYGEFNSATCQACQYLGNVVINSPCFRAFETAVQRVEEFFITRGLAEISKCLFDQGRPVSSRMGKISPSLPRSGEPAV